MVGVRREQYRFAVAGGFADNAFADESWIPWIFSVAKPSAART